MKKKRFKINNPGRKAPVDPLDRIVVRLPCFEPAGCFLEMDERAVCQHVLVVGSSGSGKTTTVLNGMLRDLIYYRASESAGRPGLLVMDNQNDSYGKISKLARDAGRESDLVHLSPTDGWYCPLGRLERWADLDRVTSRMMLASEIAQMSGGDNPYWSQVTTLLIETGLTVMLVTSQKVTFSDTLEFLAGWLITDSGTISRADKRINLFHQLVRTSEKLSSPVRAKVEFAAGTLAMFKELDARTKSILRSLAAAVLKPFLSKTALGFWDASRGERIRPDLVAEGRIVVISVPSILEPELARTLGRLCKMDFYEVAQSRPYQPGDRLLSMIQDEYPLSVSTGSSRWSDINNLATLRAKGAFLIAATQGLANLALAVEDRASLEALRLNFSNLFFFRTQEPEVGTWAERIFGETRPELKPAQGMDDDGWPDPSIRDLIAQTRPPIPGCPAGCLGRLQVSQAFVSLASGEQLPNPLWLAPNFIDGPPEDPEPKTFDPDMEAFAQARTKLRQETSDPEADIPF
jgi:hypothetical protein